MRASSFDHFGALCAVNVAYRQVQMATGMRVEGHNCTDPVLYDGMNDLYGGIPELASVMCVHATMSQPPQLQNCTVKTQQLLQPIMLVSVVPVILYWMYVEVEVVCSLFSR